MAQDRLEFAEALSTAASTPQAADEICRQIEQRFSGPADLAVLLASPHHAENIQQLSGEVLRRLAPRTLLGCTGESIVSGALEIEDAPAVALWLARLPGATIVPWHLQFERTPEGGSFVGWPDNLPEEWPAGAAALMLGEPFSFPADLLLERWNQDRPGVPVLGGMSSGARRPGDNRLLLGDQVLQEGAVGALVHGPFRVQSVVSQGCRPIGRHYVITKAEQNIILELGGKPPLAQFQELYEGLSDPEQRLVQSGLHVGRVINEYQDAFRRGDFLVRNVVGADRQTGAIAVGDYMRAGQTVQFHLRDSQTADEDLRELLARVERPADDQIGGLLFTCNGRGTRLFDRPHHDASVVRELLGNVPLAGFFAQGEMGPIGGKNFLHGFTASLALFTPK